MRRLALAAAVAAFAGCGPDAPPPAAVATESFCPTCLPSGGAHQEVSKDFLKPAGSRTFAVEVVAKVPAVPPGTRRLRVWAPVPPESTVQSVRNLAFSAEAKLGVEPKYGNRIAYWEVANPGASFEVAMKFHCTRLEIVTDLEKLAEEGKDPADAYRVFLRPDQLVLVDDEMKRISDGVVKDRKTALGKARAIYDHVVSKMTYDKNHEGWGKGSTRHACDVGKGNCTDFHALFNSLCRAQGVASGFEIGLYLPYAKNKVEPLGGYHCWAFFRVPGKTWVPVDASEASRFPDRAEYFFGGHTPNRVTLSTGRDIDLVPRQDGPPLNYLLNPHAEADGKPLKAEKSWSYQDLD